jgi:tRNA(Ile)-lysidine synthase
MTLGAHELRSHSAVVALLTKTNFSSIDSLRPTVACAVSGGADSVALLILALAHGMEVTAYHVDHGLRDGSHHEADLVAEVAERFGAQFVSLRIELDDGPNLEARARNARFAALPSGVLTGHTADDQAETVLINLMRGSGTDGLGGMRKSHTKPLLGLRRAETHALCNEFNITVVSDPSNDDPRFQRNRVRHELVPLLDSIARRDVAAIIARDSLLIGDDEQYLQELASFIDVHDAQALASAPLPLARRAIRMWLANPYPPDSATVERVLDVARGIHPGCNIDGNRQVRRSNQRLRLQ